ncbi:MAG TPA: FAD-dependent oxidoreductase [Actinomycetota bacterium]|nr:FAD-dependent oxidoreductase [Actinomycetota bacterium]
MDADDARFPTLDEHEMAALDALGTRRLVAAGEYLYRSGDATYDFYAVVSGTVEITVPDDAGGQYVLTQHTPGRFLGELNLVTGLRVFATARAVEAGEVIQVPRAVLRHLIATSPTLGDKVLGAFLARREGLLTQARAAIQVVGSRFSPGTPELLEFLNRLQVPYAWRDPDREDEVEQALPAFNIEPGDLPAVIVSGKVLKRPTPGELSEYLGLTLASLPGRCFDLVVVGSGPAGLAAVVYGASEGLRTLGLEMAGVGGQAGSSSRIENYLGFPRGVSGTELTTRAVVQAEKFGANLSVPCTAVSLDERAGHLVVTLSDGTEVGARAVIAATGARYRRLEAEGLADFEGNGVHYSATKLEAAMCAGSPVVVVGGGNSAGQAAVFLAENGSPTTVAIRGSDLGASMSRYLVDRIEDDHRIQVLTGTTVTALQGERALASIRVSGGDGERVLPCLGLFSFIGAEPSSGWLSGCAALDDRGFVLTDRSLTADQLDGRWITGRDPLPFETSFPGLFAVGDLRAGSMKRVAAAVGEGSSAVRSVHEYLAFDHSTP